MVMMRMGERPLGRQTRQFSLPEDVLRKIDILRTETNTDRDRVVEEALKIGLELLIEVEKTKAEQLMVLKEQKRRQAGLPPMTQQEEFQKRQSLKERFS